VQLEQGRAEVDNAYARVVSEQGNTAAQALIAEVFETTDRAWRGIGMIPGSGWKLAAGYRVFDAERKFAVSDITAHEPSLCRSGDVLRGALKPHRCPAFGRECTPRSPLGATMVSGEGACAAYFHAGRFDGREVVVIDCGPVVGETACANP
jgi:hydrogenase expression/formation protein HypD